jgi:peptidoglycan/LPS O-acetylase OafA/YrhL
VGVTPRLNAASTQRFDELDSLRGLAALSVVLLHFESLWVGDAMLGSSPHQKHIVEFLLLPFTTGNEAVVLFFVLSGFVLSIPAINLRAQTYPVFIVRRIFRIYVPYVAALILAVLGNLFFSGDVTRSQSFFGTWSSPVDWHLFMQHLIFVGEYNTDKFDPPIWSLVFEMRVSLIFPLLCAMVLRLRPGVSLILAACVSGVLIFTMYYLPSVGNDQSYLATLHYAALFVVGIYLARQRVRISEKLRRFTKRGKIEIAIFSALVYIYAGYGLRIWAHRFTQYDLGRGADWLTALGASGIIVLSVNSGWCSRALHWSPIHSLGKMSYSVYLLHYIIMSLSVHLLYGKLPLLAILALALVVVIAVSWVFYRFVETPSIKMGRKLTQYI